MQQCQQRRNDKDNWQLTTETERSFDKIYKEYGEKIFRYAMSITQCREDAEDVTQEIFLKVWVKYNYLMGIENLKDYLYAMARNYIVNRYRRKKRICSVSAERFSGIEDHYWHDRILVKEVQQAYHQAVCRLPERQKLVYQLRENDCHCKEIADVLNLSPNTVKNHFDMASKSVRSFVIQKIGITKTETKKSRLRMAA